MRVSFGGAGLIFGGATFDFEVLQNGFVFGGFRELAWARGGDL